MMTDVVSNITSIYKKQFIEDIIQSKYKAGTNGQFFTPQEVSQLMSKLIVTDTENVFINDCACGSGRLLLDTHQYNPSSILIGQDLDSVACKMAVLNFYVSGVRGSILHMDTLTGDFYGAWRVNNYLYYGLPVPHIERVSELEAYNFIGVTKDCGSVEVNKGVSVQSTLI